MTPPERMPAGQDAWMHELRNAVNAVAMAVALGRGGSVEGDIQRMRTALTRAEEGLVRVRSLLMHPAIPPAHSASAASDRR